MVRSNWSLGDTVRRCGPLTLHEATRSGRLAGHAWRCRGPKKLRELFMSRSSVLGEAAVAGLRVSTKVSTTNKGSPFRIDALPAGAPALVCLEDVRFDDEDIREILGRAALTLRDLHDVGRAPRSRRDPTGR